jgi:hypothetical protein
MTREQMLDAALLPFAEAAKSRVVRDALSFAPEANVDLMVSRGFDQIRIPASAFAAAREALKP